MTLLFCYQGPRGLKYVIRKDVHAGIDCFMIVHYVLNGKKKLQGNEKHILFVQEKHM